ncbi:DUF1796 family putative cysteine peptidase [Agrobacterium sp. DSM 25558]|uniref:DUF1796 family putative cysteine peptidase n=1 Tax=Agrobacterium sp. DSM 25558 TaxID=1907665 RepID=UPI00097D4BAC
MHVGHKYISLGAACNAANMIKIAGLRRTSYPFDWLLNLEDGLTTVTDIIRDDFQKVSPWDCYDVVSPPDAERTVLAYKHYPRTFHIHSDPSSNREIHEQLTRRFQRLKRALSSRDSLHLIYYRNLSACRATRPDITPAEVAQLMLSEWGEFLRLISPWRQGDTTVLLVLECDVEDVEQTDRAIDIIEIADPKVALKRAISRYDDDAALYDRWQKEWAHLIINHTRMPIWLQVRCHAKRAVRSIRKSIKSRLRSLS